MDATTVRQTLNARRKQHDTMQAENDVADRQITALRKKMDDLAVALGIGQEALQFLEDVSMSRRSALKAQIESIVTEALQLVYGPGQSVELVYDVKAGRSFVDIKLVKPTPAGDVKRGMDGFGGGVSDVISVPLRLLVLLASRQTDKVCVLDEAYKHLDLDRVDKAAAFVSEIAARLGIQIVLCSHHEAMREAAGTVYTVEEKDGKSTVKLAR